MMFATPCEPFKVNPVLAKAMDRVLILHADHEQNASTSTVRLAGSSGANPFACIAAGIASLWGPAHGGANEAVLRMLEEIGDKSRVPEYIRRAKDKDDPFRLMGFGHRVYHNYDPRARIVRQTCHDVLDELGVRDEPLLDLAMELERIALEDEYFVSKKLYPNVDFGRCRDLCRHRYRNRLSPPHCILLSVFRLEISAKTLPLLPARWACCRWCVWL